MPTQNFDSSDVMMGEANILLAPRGTTKPDDTTVAYNDYASWPAGWQHLGYTESGPSFNYSFEVAEARAQQSGAPLIRRKNTESLVITANLLQLEAANIAYATGGTVTHTNAVPGTQKPLDKILAGGASVLTEYMFAIEGYRPDTSGNLQPVRLFLPRGTIRQNGETTFARNAAAMIPVQVEALLDSSLPVGQQLFDMRIILGPAA